MNDRVKKYKYSEIFRSIQGEGKYTGRPTLWYRAWGCNFDCLGFSSPDPQNVKVEEMPYMNVPLEGIEKMSDLPVFEKGCDSSYSWAKRFSHLAPNETAEEIATKLINLLPTNNFLDGNSGEQWHMAFTGGEPMMSQSAVVAIMEEFATTEDKLPDFYGPSYVTFETNGTQMPRQNFIDHFKHDPCEVFWSCSPKLYASGEQWEKAIRPEVLVAYNDISPEGQLKYVVDGSDAGWDEVAKATQIYRDSGVNWPVYIMPVGALKEQQENNAGIIADMALDRGYNVSARVHCYLWGNKIGT